MKQSFSAIIQGLKILATNVGAINGITSDINSESNSIAASSKMVHDLNSNLSIKINTYSFLSVNVIKDKLTTIEKEIDIPNGYKPVGIVGWTLSHPSWGSIRAIRLINNSRNTVRIYFYTNYADYSENLVIDVMMLPTIWFT